MREIEFAIKDEPASKSNSRMNVTIRGVSRSIKSRKALAYTKSFRAQMPDGVEPLTASVVAHITIWYASRRPDLDESLILDLLQVDEKKYRDTKGVILNDRQVREKHVYWKLDPANPRCEIRLVESPELDPPRPKGKQKSGVPR